MMNIYTLFACYRMKNLKAPKGAKYMNSFICRFIWHETTTIISKPFDAALDKGNPKKKIPFFSMWVILNSVASSKIHIRQYLLGGRN